jgi:hypothetical protein
VEAPSWFIVLLCLRQHGTFHVNVVRFSLCERKNEQQKEDMALPVVWGLGIGVPHDWDTAGLKPSARTTKPVYTG